MVALADVVQVAERVLRVVDTHVLALQSALTPLEHVGREAVRRAISEAASTAQRAAPASMAVGSDVGFDLVVAKVDPTAGLNPKTFAIDGANAHPSIKEDLSHLTHATTEKERHDRERGRGSRQAFINPVPRQDVVPWASPEPPLMLDGAQMQNRHPLMKV